MDTIMANEMTVIQDLHGRVHDYLRISITENCNLRCKYCMPAEGINLTPKSHIMTADEIETIAKIFVGLGVKKIRLTGGEPLVRKDAKDIILRLGKLGVSLHITSNGVLVDEYIETFKTAGIRTINISLDTLQKEKYNIITRRDTFDAVWNNIDLLVKNGFKVNINVVLMKDFNESEIVDFVNLTRSSPIQVRFIEFMPFNGNQWDKSKLITYADILSQLQTHFSDHQVIRTVDKPNDTSKNHKIDTFTGSFSVISSVTNPFCDSCNRIRLTADGKLKNCLFSNTEDSLLDALRNGEDLLPIIHKNITSKFKVRGGMEEDAEFQDPLRYSENRSMIKIGG
jgi:molybdenum cofactor biosynthesis protein A